MTMTLDGFGRERGLPTPKGDVVIFGRPPTIDDLPVLKSSPFAAKQPTYAVYLARMTVQSPRDTTDTKEVVGYVFGRSEGRGRAVVYYSSFGVPSGEEEEFLQAGDRGWEIPVASIKDFTAIQAYWQPAPRELLERTSGRHITTSNC